MSSSSSSSRHSSSHRHSSSRKREKQKRLTQNIFAFLLFLSVTALSLSVCAKIAFVNPQNIVNMFTDKEYVAALQEDVLQYAHDVCAQSSVPTDSVDGELTYSAISEIERAYVAGAFGTTEQYTTTTYQDDIEVLNGKLVTSANEMLKTYRLDTGKNKKELLVRFADDITDYLQRKVEFNFMERLQTITNLGNTVSVVMIVVSAILTVVMFLIVYSTDEKKRYKSLRPVAYSLTAAALLELLLVGGVEMIKTFKTLVIYPTYLVGAVMKYVGGCELCVFLSAVVLFLAALAVMSVVWKLKRDSNN